MAHHEGGLNMGILASFFENEKSECTPATLATPATFPCRQNQKSQLSQGVTAKMRFWKGQPMRRPNRTKPSAGMALASVPETYLDAWARLQCQKPMGASNEEWRQVIDDAGRF